MITVENLTKVYGRTVAVNDISFTVRPGVVTGFLGPNGAGKTTTMRMMVGLDQPTAGRVHFDGKPYQDFESPLRQVGALLDAKWVHPNRSARAHLRWLAAANGISTRRVDDVLAQVGLSDVAGKRAGGFSLGMSQRLGLAAALLGDPPVLLLDEPVNGLDPEGIVWIRMFMKELAAQGRTVLVSSHLLTEMSLTADHVVVIGRGRIIADCSIGEFTKSARTTVRVRSPQLQQFGEVLTRNGIAVQGVAGANGPELIVDGVRSEQVGDLAASNGVTLHELSTATASLEDVFMSLTADDVQYRAPLAHPASP